MIAVKVIIVGIRFARYNNYNITPIIKNIRFNIKSANPILLILKIFL